jgi:hypothetical protein
MTTTTTNPTTSPVARPNPRPATRPAALRGAATRRLPVQLARQAGDQVRRLRHVLTAFRDDTAIVLAVCCPACHRWVKPTRYDFPAGTCRRCGRNRTHHTHRPPE